MPTAAASAGNKTLVPPQGLPMKVLVSMVTIPEAGLLVVRGPEGGALKGDSTWKGPPEPSPAGPWSLTSSQSLRPDCMSQACPSLQGRNTLLGAGEGRLVLCPLPSSLLFSARISSRPLMAASPPKTFQVPLPVVNPRTSLASHSRFVPLPGKRHQVMEVKYPPARYDCSGTKSPTCAKEAFP